MRTRNSLLLVALFFIFTSLGSSVIAQTKVVRANQYPGADLGAKVNAADKALGSGAGEIVLSGGGRISTQIVISGNHTLRLERGTYSATTALPPILLKPGSKLIGPANWEAIILESTAPNQFTVISA